MSLVQQPLPAPSFPPTPCPECGSPSPNPHNDAPSREKILELEAQVRRLNSKAAATADKLADYEDELAVLRAKAASSPVPVPPGIISPPPDGTTGSQQQHHRLAPAFSSSSPPKLSRLSSLSSLLPSRRSPASPPPPLATPGLSPPQTNISTRSLPSQLPPDQPPPSADHLSNQLQVEKKARLAAESSLSAAHTELEELTAQLFGQANEMVASERKARAKLEERVQVLERRDGEKRARLERLEKAMGRIERVRGMVG